MPDPSIAQIGIEPLIPAPTREEVLSTATIGTSVGLMAMSAYLISKAALAFQVTDLSLARPGAAVR